MPCHNLPSTLSLGAPRTQIRPIISRMMPQIAGKMSAVQLQGRRTATNFGTNTTGTINKPKIRPMIPAPVFQPHSIIG